MKVEEQQVGVGLITLCIILTPFARAGEMPIIIMAVLGLWKFFHNRDEVLKIKAVKYYSILFLLLWIPMLISAIDAVNFSKSIVSSLQYIRFYFAGIYIFFILRDRRTIDLVVKISSYVLLFWICDGLFQYVVGYDLFGFEKIYGRANGIFGKHLKLGLFLGAYLPILYFYIISNFKKMNIALVFVLATLAILLAGSRAGWVMLFVGLVGQLIVLYAEYRTFPKKIALVAFVVITVVISASYYALPSFSARVNQSALIFSMDSKLIDQALSTRLPIWETGWEVFKDNYINGIGAKGFRYAYNNYAKDGDIYVNEEMGIGAYHSHNIIVEIGTETGTIGLVGFMLFCLAFFRVWWISTWQQKFASSPFLLALLAVLFPFNTHFAFYGGAASQVMFWLLALLLATLYCSENGFSSDSRVCPR